MSSPRITCVFHNAATVTALLKTPAGRGLAGDLLVECSRRPSLGLVLNLETPANYPGVAGLLGGIDPATLAHSADGLPAPIILAAGEEVAIDAIRTALGLLSRPDDRLSHVTLLVPIGAARTLGAALAVCDRFAVAWDVAQFPHEVGTRDELLDGGQSRGRDRGRQRVGEELRSRTLRQIVGQGRRPRGESARRPTERLAKCRRDDIDLAVQPIVLGCATSRVTHHTGAVAVIDGHDGVVLPRQLDNVG